MFYSHNNQYPEMLPKRIRLSNGNTRTDISTFTEEELTDAGYIAIGDQPAYDNDTQKVIWNGSSWEIVALTTEEINNKISQLWVEVREKRDIIISEVEWRILRFQSEVRMGLEPTDDIQQLDTYIQALRDITKHSDNPLEITWPALDLSLD
jgi:hypothetical protein